MNSFNKNLQILLVDDDAMVKSILHEYLLSMGFENIIVAKKSTHALQLIQDNKTQIDLVISDWEMPEVSGLVLLKAVRNNPFRRELPFMIVTSQRSMERFKISQARSFTVDAYLIKPFRMEVLKDRIYEVMRWKKDVAS